MRFGLLREKVLARLRPVDQRRLDFAVGKLLARLWFAADALDHDVELFVGGSTAKGTYLRGDHDIDLFVRFNPKYPSDLLADVLAEILVCAGLEHERIHGSRDYFHVCFNRFLFEIVPVLNITDPKQAKNVTDMSPLHVTYVSSKLTPRMRDEIRLAKQFCKSARVYGAESYIRGFSGHVLDLLIIHYGSFLKLLRAAAKWKPKVVIDVEQHHADPLKRLDTAKLHSPLVVVDPVQPDRNAAAALSQERFDAFIRRAQSFLKDPSPRFFSLRRMRLPKPGRSNAIITLLPLPGSDDVAGTKCLKAYEHILKHAREGGFTITKTDFHFDGKQAVAYLVVKEALLPKTFEWSGPPVNASKDAIKFKRKHGAAGNPVVVRGNRLYATVNYNYRTIRSLVKSLIAQEYVTSRVQKATVR